MSAVSTRRSSAESCAVSRGDPAQRPATALAVSASLPGGDPLAAALAAGETPSPEMVAEAGGQEGIRPLVGLAMLVVILAGMIGVAALGGRLKMVGRVDLPLPTAALVAEAQEILAEVGYPEPAHDRAHGFDVDDGYLSWVESRVHGAGALGQSAHGSSGADPFLVPAVRGPADPADSHRARDPGRPAAEAIRHDIPCGSIRTAVFWS